MILNIFNMLILILASTFSEIKGIKTFSRTRFNEEAEKILIRHNVFRECHHAPPLELDDDLTKDWAQDWANELALSGSSLEHRPYNRYGENLYSIRWKHLDDLLSDKVFKQIAFNPVDSWYNEIKQYDGSGFHHETGHLTQLLWKNSKRLGVGIAQSDNNIIYVVCNYDPPGNVLRRFETNVSPIGQSWADDARKGIACLTAKKSIVTDSGYKPLVKTTTATTVDESEYYESDEETTTRSASTERGRKTSSAKKTTKSTPSTSVTWKRKTCKKNSTTMSVDEEYYDEETTELTTTSEVED